MPTAVLNILHNFSAILKSVLVGRKSLGEVRRHFLATRFFDTNVDSVTAVILVIAIL